jgi:hypothetical protein
MTHLKRKQLDTKSNIPLYIKKIKLNSYRFNNISAINSLNNFNIPIDISLSIKSFLFDKEKSKNQWKNRISESLSIIDKYCKEVPCYLFLDNYDSTDLCLVPCTECYLYSVLTGTIDKENCISCDVFQMKNGFYCGLVEFNIYDFNYYEPILKICPRFARIIFQSNIYIAKNILIVPMNGIIMPILDLEGIKNKSIILKSIKK